MKNCKLLKIWNWCTKIKKVIFLRLSYGKILNPKYAVGTSLKDICLNTAPLVVLGFGKNTGTTNDFPLVNRVNGRKDYQLLFIAEGQMDFIINNQKFTYGANTLILFRPGEPQIYNISEGSEATSYYIHFSGSKVEEYLKYYGINEQVIAFSKPFTWFERIFNEMDLNHKSPFREDICNSILMTLLGIIGGTLRSEQPLASGKFATLTHIMRQNCTKNYPIAKYADFLGYSEMHFIAFFKSHLGKTPHKYIVDHRMQVAKRLLLTTNDSIKSIAVQVGYPNSRYFSRVFAKYFKKTPSEFRQTEKK